MELPPAPRPMKPLLIGIAGGSHSGKTQIAESIAERLNLVDEVIILDQKSFHRDRTTNPEVDNPRYNFDHPDAFDYPLMASTVQSILAGGSVDIPDYDLVSHTRSWCKRNVSNVNVVIFVGVYVLYWKELREELDLRLFINVDDDIRLCEAFESDNAIAEGTVGVLDTVNKYLTFVKPAHDRFAKPTMKYADLIVPNGASNITAMAALVELIKLQLLNGGQQQPVHPVVHVNLETVHSAKQVEATEIVHLLYEDEVLHGDMTRSTLVFYVDRLTFLLLGQTAVRLNPTQSRPVICAMLTGVSDAMESGLRDWDKLAEVTRYILGKAVAARSQISSADSEPSIHGTPPRPAAGQHHQGTPPHRAGIHQTSMIPSGPCSAEECRLTCIAHHRVKQGAVCMVLWPVLTDLGALEAWFQALLDSEESLTLAVVTMFASPEACRRLATVFPKVSITVGLLLPTDREVKMLARKVHHTYLGLRRV